MTHEREWEYSTISFSLSPKYFSVLRHPFPRHQILFFPEEPVLGIYWDSKHLVVFKWTSGYSWTPSCKIGRFCDVKAELWTQSAKKKTIFKGANTLKGKLIWRCDANSIDSSSFQPHLAYFSSICLRQLEGRFNWAPLEGKGKEIIPFSCSITLKMDRLIILPKRPHLRGYLIKNEWKFSFSEWAA